MSPDTATRALATESPDRSLAPVEIRPLRDADEAAWENYVERAPQATFFHRLGWRQIIERTLGHATRYRCAWRGGRLVGFLPLMHVKSRLFGDALISTAFTTGGGIVADDNMAAQALADDDAELGQRFAVDFVELRQSVPLPIGTAWHAKTELYFGFERALAVNDADNLKAIPRKKRADLRKAIDDRRLVTDTDAPVETFFGIYAESLRNLGTPVLPLRFYRAIKATFGDAVEISTVAGPGGPAAALMSFYFKDRVLPYYGGAAAACVRLDVLGANATRGSTRRAPVRFRTQQTRHGLVRLQDLLGIRTDAAWLSVPAGETRQSAGNQPAQSKISPDGRHLAALPAGARQPDRSGRRPPNRLSRTGDVRWR
ncbi:MAG: GNAT family N-acetyltransferase [Stellaceae bacterium]